MSQENGFNRFRGTPGYIASGPLVDAVNCAIALQRPLLIKGEPGTGKTVLARHVAEGLGMPLIQWHIKSTSKAVDGLYVYDTVQRLNDSRFGDGDVSDIRRYIKYGPLGQAFAQLETPPADAPTPAPVTDAVASAPAEPGPGHGWFKLPKWLTFSAARDPSRLPSGAPSPFPTASVSIGD